MVVQQKGGSTWQHSLRVLYLFILSNPVVHEHACNGRVCFISAHLIRRSVHNCCVQRAEQRVSVRLCSHNAGQLPQPTHLWLWYSVACVNSVVHGTHALAKGSRARQHRTRRIAALTRDLCRPLSASKLNLMRPWALRATGVLAVTLRACGVVASWWDAKVTPLPLLYLRTTWAGVVSVSGLCKCGERPECQ